MQIYAGSNACSSMGAPRTPRRETSERGAALAVFWRWRIKTGRSAKTALRACLRVRPRAALRAPHTHAVCVGERRETLYVLARAAATRPALPTELVRPD
eukprot:scaffold32495_cov60-Phaeocystis_antarctica.AAC.6